MGFVSRSAREAVENLESPFLDEEIVTRGSGGMLDEADVPLDLWRADDERAEDEGSPTDALSDSDQAETDVEPELEPFSSEGVEEEVIDPDTRTRVADTLQAPNRWICAIDVMSENPKWGSGSEPRLICKSRGTGILIGPRYVLTAAHVFGASRTAAASLPTEHFVSPARNGDNSKHPFGKIKTTSIHVSRAYQIQQQVRIQGRVTTVPMTVWDDYALVILEKDVASSKHSKLKGTLGYWGGDARVAVVKRLPRTDLEQKRVVVTGYPGDACGDKILAGSSSEKESKANKCWYNRNDAWASTQWRGEGTLSVNAAGTLVYHDADTYQGQSGGPICLKIGGVQHLVGIHTDRDNAQRNKGVPVTLRMLQELCGWINADAGYEAAIVQNDTLTFQPAGAQAGAKEVTADLEFEEYASLQDEWWRGPESSEGPLSSPAADSYEAEPADLAELETVDEGEALENESFEQDAETDAAHEESELTLEHV